MIMLQAFLFAALLAPQETKPAKTVEQRIQELADRIAVLDKKATDLAAENHDLQRKLAVQEQARDSMAKATADAWMKRHTGGLSLDEAKGSVIEGLWVTWTREDFVKPADPAAWKKREEMLRKQLTPEQAALVEKSVRDGIASAMDLSIGSYGKQARIAPEREPVFRKTVWNHLKQEEAGLIPQAHAGAGVSWSGLYSALQSSLPELAAVLTPEEHARLSQLLAPRKEK
jgi:hypothetical protein